jgi:hypothetical protein
MTNKTLMTLLLALATLPASAQDFGSVFGQALPLVAQMSQEERRTLRERWEYASPEERAQMRRIFQERLRQMPPERFDPRPNELREQMNERWLGNGFGTGYEHRRYEEGDSSGADRGQRPDERRDRGRR